VVNPVARSVPYAAPPQERQSLDIYAPPNAAKAPVVVWVHGGGWMRGSKDEMNHKPAAFLAKGFLFVPVNYRFIPDVKMGDIIGDVARAAGWVRKNIARYGGDPDRIFLMGHSAGAQLAAILCVDPRHLKAEGVPLSSVKGCVPVDGDTYDVPLQVATATARRKSLNQPPPKWGHPEKFGDLKLQRAYSAVYHAGPNRGIPPFLILHVSDHTDTAAQAYRLWSALDYAGLPARLVAADGTDHSRLDQNLGREGDPSTKALFEFLDSITMGR
jgi:acetyl esterase/lipase